MNAQQIIDRALRLTHTNLKDYAIEQSVEDLNLVYQDMVDEIVVNTKGDYFWDVGRSDTVVFQSEYVAEKLGISPDDLDIKKINDVFVKYDTSDTYKTKLRFQNPSTLENHPDYYKVNQSKRDPFFYIQDTSIFIYPAPDIAIADGLEIFVDHKPAELVQSSGESDIEIPSQFHKVIADGLKIYIYQSQRKTNEAQAAQVEFDRGVDKMVSFMKQRYNKSRRKTITWLDDFR